MITGIVGVVIWTDNLKEMETFYRDTLELKLHSRHEDFIAFDLGPGMRLNLGKHSQVRGQARDPYRIMINLGVQDIRTAYAKLQARGVRFLRPPEKERWGGFVATFQDPDGNIIQLLQQPA